MKENEETVFGSFGTEAKHNYKDCMYVSVHFLKEFITRK
jgi:hypothetical protein